MVRERSGGLGWGDQGNPDHRVPWDELGAAADVEVQILCVALQQEPFAPHLQALVVPTDHLNRKSAETAEVAVVVKIVADARAADLQNIGIA